MIRFRRIFIIIAFTYISTVLLSSILATKKSLFDIKFKNNVCLMPHHAYNYLTCAPMKVAIDGNEVSIHVGFNSDLATVPHWLWSIIEPQYAALAYPAILHDYLYQCPAYYTRWQVDNIFYSAMIERGMSKNAASRIYYAVRLFGWYRFNKGIDCEFSGYPEI